MNQELIQAPIVYVDLDGVVADIATAVQKYKDNHPWVEDTDEIYDMLDFESIPVMAGAKEFIAELMKNYQVFFASTAPWNQPEAWLSKRIWCAVHFPKMYKKLILTHRKDLLMGNYLVDDRTKNGASSFSGKFIHFGTEKYPDFKSVLSYIQTQEQWDSIRQ